MLQGHLAGPNQKHPKIGNINATTEKQEHYCRRASGGRRFCYNLAVAIHRFHRANRLPWPSWQDIYKASGSIPTGFSFKGFPQQQAVPCVPLSERETQAGTVLDLSTVRGKIREKPERGQKPEKPFAPRQGANAPRREGADQHLTCW